MISYVRLYGVHVSFQERKEHTGLKGDDGEHLMSGSSCLAGQCDSFGKEAFDPMPTSERTWPR